MRALEALIELAPPPATPQGAPFDWDAAEAVVGSSLPADYKAYCDAYGHGGFDNGWGWRPFAPFAQDPAHDLVSTYWRDMLADHVREQRPFPEPGGVLPFAICELKYGFWWLTDGPPDGWPVLVEDDGGTWHRFELTATEVLILALRDRLFDGAGDPRRATFHSSAQRTPKPQQPFVISSYGTAGEGHHVTLDLAGGLGGTRRARLDELLAALEPSLRARIMHAEAKRSMEVLLVRSRADIEPLCVAVQAWADRVSGWS
jgi:hypothetical protein